MRGEDEQLTDFASQTKGAVYTLLGCSGADVLLRGKHIVNRIAYTVLPLHAPEEIIVNALNVDSGNER